MRTLGALIPVLLSLGLTACEGGLLDSIGDLLDDEDAQPTPGLLARGKFFYVCIGAADPQCDAVGRGDFPLRVAVGNRFAVDYEGPDGEPIKDHLVISSSDTRLLDLDGVLVALVPGLTPVLALNDERQVEDMAYIEAVTPDLLELLVDGSAVSELQLEVGQDIELRARPSDAGMALAGLPTPTWQIDDPALVALVDPLDERVTLRGIAAGQTTVTATNGVAATLTLTVVDPDAPGTSSGSSGGSP